MLLLLGGLVAGSLWLWRDRFFEQAGWTGMFVVVGLTLGLVSALGVLLRHRHRGIIVFWCRRFGNTETEAGARNRWMWTLVSQACKGLAHPVTLQDASLQGSQVVGQSLQTPLGVAGLTLGIPLLLALYLRAEAAIGSNLLKWAVGVGALVLYTGLFIGVGRLAIWMTTSFATDRVDAGAMQRKLSTVKERGWARRELDVLRCTSDDWRAHVAAMLEVADLVIIDCAESTQHLSWEMALARHRLGEENVLMFSPAESGARTGLDRCWLAYDQARARDEIASLSQQWGEDDYPERTVQIGPYGDELAGRIHEWMETRARSVQTSPPIVTT